MIRADRRALAGPMASKCLAIMSSGLIFCAKDDVGLTKANVSKARARSRECFGCSVIVIRWERKKAETARHHHNVSPFRPFPEQLELEFRRELNHAG
jgi:hypothetical protein